MTVTLCPKQIGLFDFTDYETVLDTICEQQERDMFKQTFPNMDYEEYATDVKEFYNNLNREEQITFNSMNSTYMYYIDSECEKNKITIKKYKTTFENALKIQTSVTMNDDDFNLVMEFFKPIDLSTAYA